MSYVKQSQVKQIKSFSKQFINSKKFQQETLQNNWFYIIAPLWNVVISCSVLSGLGPTHWSLFWRNWYFLVTLHYGLWNLHRSCKLSFFKILKYLFQKFQNEFDQLDAAGSKMQFIIINISVMKDLGKVRQSLLINHVLNINVGQPQLKPQLKLEAKEAITYYYYILILWKTEICGGRSKICGGRPCLQP